MITQIIDPSNYFFNNFAIPTLLISGLVLLVGFVVLVREQLSRVSVAFFLLTLPMSLWLFSFTWMYSSSTEAIAVSWAKAGQLGVCFIPAVVFHFTVILLGNDRRYRNFYRTIWVVSGFFAVATLSTSAVITGAQSHDWGYYLEYGRLGTVFMGFFILVIALAFFCDWTGYRRAKPGSYKLRIQFHMVALGFASLAIVDFFPAHGFRVAPVGYIPALFSVVMAAWAIWRYQLSDLTLAFTTQKIMDTMTDMLIVFDLDGVVRMVNRSVCNFFNQPATQFIDKTIQDFSRFECPPKQLEVLVNNVPLRDFELNVHSGEGKPSVLSVSTSMIYDSSEHPAAVVCIARDISERKQIEADFEYRAGHDVLTDLPNRTLLLDRLRQAILQAPRQKRLVAILFLDLDYFKRINDSLGHTMGDALLKAVGERLKTCMREGDTVARLGGDEFALVLADVSKPEDVARLAKKVLELLSQPYQLGGHELFVSASLGVSSYPADGNDSDSLLKNADTAMYRAKEQGGNNYQHYSSEMNTRMLKGLEFESHLRHAVERNELILHYQPIMDLNTEKIVSMEALVRWRRPESGMVPPADFIPLAEETGLILPIGEWVLRTALAQNKAWQEAGLRRIRMAVNLSARQFQQPDLVEMITRILNEVDLDPRYLELELTEGHIMRNPEETILTLNKLRELGVEIAIDDFGTGYSSLDYLKRFPISRLKIDRSFVRDIITDEDDKVIVSTVILMARSLDMRVIAEGVELTEQLDYLSSAGCHEAQGFLLSRPVPAEEAGKLLTEKTLLRVPGDG